MSELVCRKVKLFEFSEGRMLGASGSVIGKVLYRKVDTGWARRAHHPRRRARLCPRLRPELFRTWLPLGVVRS